MIKLSSYDKSCHRSYEKDGYDTVFLGLDCHVGSSTLLNLAESDETYYLWTHLLTRQAGGSARKGFLEFTGFVNFSFLS